MGIQCPKCHSDNTDTARFCSNCAAPLPSSKEIPVTETLETPKEELTTGSIFAGRYQIIEELGKGGMGKVYKALDTDLKEKVAIKLIKPEVAADEKTIERFRNELKLARKIRHKNVFSDLRANLPYIFPKNRHNSEWRGFDWQSRSHGFKSHQLHHLILLNSRLFLDFVF